MSNGEDRLIGEIHAMVKEAQLQRAELFHMLREVRESGCNRGRTNADAIDKLQRNQTRLIYGAVAVVASMVGIDRLVALLF